MASLFTSCFTVFLIFGIGSAYACDMNDLQTCLKLMTVDSSDQYAICGAMDEAKSCLMNLTESACAGRINETAAQILRKIEDDRSRPHCKDFQGKNSNFNCTTEDGTDEVIRCFKMFPIPMTPSERPECGAIPAIKSCLKPLTDKCPGLLDTVYSRMPYNPMLGLEAMCLVKTNVSGESANATNVCTMDCMKQMTNLTNSTDPSVICSAMSDTQLCLQNVTDGCDRQMFGVVQNLLDKSGTLCANIEDVDQPSSVCTIDAVTSCTEPMTHLNAISSQEAVCSALNESTSCLETLSSRGCSGGVMKAVDNALAQLKNNESVCENNDTVETNGTSRPVNVTTPRPVSVTTSRPVSVPRSRPVSVPTPRPVNVPRSRPVYVPYAPACTLDNYSKCVRRMGAGIASKSHPKICRAFNEGRSCLKALVSRGCSGAARNAVNIALAQLKSTESFCENIDAGETDVNVDPAYASTSRPSYLPNPRTPYASTSRPAYASTSRPAYVSTSRPAYARNPRPAYTPPSRPAYVPNPRPAYTPTSRPAYVRNPRPDNTPTSRPAYVPNPRPAYTPTSRPAYVPNPRPVNIPNSRPAYGRNPRPVNVPACTTENVSKCIMKMDTIDKQTHPRVVCRTFHETRSCLKALSSKGCRGQAKKTVKLVLTQLKDTESSFCGNSIATVEPSSPACTSDSLYKCGPEHMTASFKTAPCQFAAESSKCLERFAFKCTGRIKVTVDRALKQLRDIGVSMCSG